MLRNKLLLMGLVCAVFLGCCGKPKSVHNADFCRLADWMSGSFSSKAQSENDSSYYEIHLQMVPVWKERQDAVYLYVEQAVAWAVEKPYRQRVYRLRPLQNGQFESTVFSLPDPLRFAGVWKEENPLSSLTPDSLMLREGCAIILENGGDSFYGSTVEQKCESTLHGAAYATSEVCVESSRLTSWDRGFNAIGEQVWGAENGPYIFDKLEKKGKECNND